MKVTRIAILIASASLASAQVYTPPASNNPNPSDSDGSGDTVINRQPEKTNKGPVMGNELPFLDPSSELVSWNGHTWSATDNRMLAARFERYLNEPPDDSEEAIAYRETIAKILELVSPHHAGGPDFAGAVALLPRASSYPGDAKLCDSLSQAIYSAVLAKKDVNGTRALNSAMDEEKRRLIRNADITASRSRLTNEETTTKGKTSTTSKTAQEGTGSNSMEYKEYLRRVAEIEALRKTNTVKNEVQIVQAKVQYQALMVQLFVQRRFEHVLMASRFYHQIFTDGDNRLRIDKKSDVSKMISDTFGTSPTVAAIDSLASEAIRDVDKGVDAFLFLSERGELQSASKRLSESYMVGEFMPSVQTLPREKKRRVLEFVRESYKLIAALDAKDYTSARALVEKIKTTASDFDATKAEAAIATYTRVGNMHIDSAKLAAASGDNEKAAAEIEKAMEVWPQNPKLAEFDHLVAQGSGLMIAKNDFDRLLSENNYREIFKRQYELAPAINGDPAREDAFKQIISNIFRIDGALEKASEFRKMGQSYAAWEQLAQLREDFPDDPKLGRELELLAPQVADFTLALNKAKNFEQRRDKQIGSALSWYLKARSIYPRSEMAANGIERLAQEIVPKDLGQSPTRSSVGEEESYDN
jgi:hypothetical protein